MLPPSSVSKNKSTKKKQATPIFLLLAWLNFYTEDWGKNIFQKFAKFYHIVWDEITEDSTLDSNLCEDIKCKAETDLTNLIIP